VREIDERGARGLGAFLGEALELPGEARPGSDASDDLGRIAQR
jgi:hypothetical protein